MADYRLRQTGPLVQEAIDRALEDWPHPGPSSDVYTKEEVNALIADFITNTVDDLVYYYTKSETYTKAETNALVATIEKFTYEVVDTLPTASAETMNKVYLVPSSDPKAGDVKDEYIDNGEEIEPGEDRYVWELIGNTYVDLSGYVTTEALNTALASYYDKTEADALLATKYEKPGPGIPKSDLASSVRAALDLAMSAYQKPVGGIPASDIADAAFATYEDILALFTTPPTPSEGNTIEGTSLVLDDQNTVSNHNVLFVDSTTISNNNIILA